MKYGPEDHLRVPGNSRFLLARPGTMPDGEDYYQDYLGYNKVFYCTKEFLVRVIRALFEQKRDKISDNFLAFHYRKDNCLYEGLKVSSWDAGGERPAEIKCEQLGLGIQSFVVEDIIEVVVS